MAIVVIRPAHLMHVEVIVTMPTARLYKKTKRCRTIAAALRAMASHLDGHSHKQGHGMSFVGTTAVYASELEGGVLRFAHLTVRQPHTHTGDSK